MRKIVFVFFLALFYLSKIYSQSIDELDKKNGFNQFQLGDSYSKWQSDLKLTEFKFQDSDTKMYFYIGSCCKNLFGFDIEGIFMTFRNNKLVEIDINFDRERNRQDSQILVDCQNRLDHIMKSLALLYGIPQSIKEPKDLSRKDPTYILGWLGKNTILKLEHSYVLSGNFECKSKITVSTSEWLQKTYKPEF